VEKKLEIQQADEGFIAFCTGNSSPFSFLAGQRQLSGTITRESSMVNTHYRYIFETQASHAPYVLQFVWADLPTDLAELDEAHDYEILLRFCHLEEQHQCRASGRNLSCNEVQLTLPTGKRYLIGISEPLDDTVLTPKSGTASHEEGPSPAPVSPFTGYALLRNGTEVIMRII